MVVLSSQYTKPTFSKTNKAVVAMKKNYIHVCFFKKTPFLKFLGMLQKSATEGA